MSPVLEEGQHCCMCTRIPDMWCEISNVNGEKGFMAWYCWEHLYAKLNYGLIFVLLNVCLLNYKEKNKKPKKRRVFHENRSLSV